MFEDFLLENQIARNIQTLTLALNIEKKQKSTLKNSAEESKRYIFNIVQKKAMILIK